MIEQEDRYSILLQSIEAERKNEESYYQSLLKTRTIQQRLDSGLLWWSIQINKQRYSIGELVEVEVERTKRVDEPHRFRVGAGARLFKEGRDDFYSGVISFVRRNVVKILLNNDKILHDNDFQYGNIGIELIYNERPYKVMRDAVEKVMKSQEPRIKELREGIRRVSTMDEYIPTEFHRNNLATYLNDSQKEAIVGVSACAQMGIIHGPPGTGKTTTIVEFITRLAKKEKKILVCAPSNNAVDLLAKMLDEKGVPVLRIGNISRIGDELTHLSLIEKTRAHPDWKHIKKVKIEAQEARKSAGQHKRSFGVAERQERKAMRKEAKELKKWARDLEDNLTNKLIDEARVICTTLVGSSHRSIDHLRYKTLIIDEASQALEPECWNAMLKTERTILAGDHLQLSPVVKSDEAKKLGLGITLLDRLSGKIKFDFLLNTQYRMNENILHFSNQQFYNNALQSHSSVATRLIRNDTQSVVFIDTSGCGFYEEFNEKRRSYHNSQEYFLLREYILQQKEKQLSYSIGLISPYSSQVGFMRSELSQDEELKGLEIEVNTIDGFQGQEKDIIYISLVRSNDHAQIGFLGDSRRLNVAMTRAKMKLVIIGDLATLTTHELYSKLADFIEEKDFYKSAWEYMSY